MSLADEVAARVEALELPFGPSGFDPWGISKPHLKRFFTAFAALYRYYFRVRAFGIENVPARGRALLVGNHAGGIAVDGAMVLTSMLLECHPPRLAHGMAERFINTTPLLSAWAARGGQLTGLPEHAERLLRDERLLMVFPEGARGVGKLYHERYDLFDFGLGFMRLALKTQAPVVPFAFLGAGAAIPTFHNSRFLGKLVGAPFVPLTAWGLPLPLPVPLEVHYLPPMHFQGTGDEEDAVVARHVEAVKAAIRTALDGRRKERYRLKRREASAP